MHHQIAAYVEECEVCDRVRSSFNSLSPQLQPSLIMRQGYHWSLDFVGPLVVTPGGANYVLVMMEHFSKWIELIALSQNSVELVMSAFLDCVLLYFLASAMNQGRECLGAFEKVCTQALIDHHTTLSDHLEVDVLVERVVQTTKRGLRKNVLLQGSHQDWDLIMPSIAMDYQFCKYVSLTSYSPY